MNRKVLVIAVAVLAVAVLATPVFGTVSACGHRSWGQPTEKIPVQFGGPGTVSPPEVKVCGNVQIGRGAILTFPGPYGIVDIRTSPPTPILTGGSSVWTANYVVNLESGKGVLHYKAVMTFSGGTFEGNVILLGTFSIAGPYVNQQEGFRYGVLRGTGDYEGWKLVISAKTTADVTTWENYLYKPLA